MWLIVVIAVSKLKDISRSQAVTHAEEVSVCVVRNTLLCAGRFDFFVVSQSVNRGTVNPTCYDVVDDDTHMPPNIAQRLTYKLCHLYYNFSVSVFTMLQILVIVIVTFVGAVTAVVSVSATHLASCLEHVDNGLSG